MTIFLRQSVFLLAAWLIPAASATAQVLKLPTKATVSVGLRVVKTTVFKVEDLLLSLSISNTSNKPVRMLFDMPNRQNFGPWATRCIVRNSKGDTIQRHQNKLIIERKEWTPAEMESFRINLRAQDWLLRLYALTDLVIFDEKKYDKSGKLPPGHYTVQVFFYDIPSPVVAFELKNPPAGQPKPLNPKPQKSGS